jgi:hypothetical protein
MEDLLLFVALIFVLFLGFALLALSQNRNWRSVDVATSLSRTGVTVLRALGCGLITLALPMALWRDGGGFGSLLWVCLLSIAAFAVTLTLSWRASWLKPLARIITGMSCTVSSPASSEHARRPEPSEPT